MRPRLLARVVSVLAGLVLLSCASSPSAPVGYSGRFEELWRRYDSTYPYFIHKRIDWDAARATSLPRAQSASTQNELVEILLEGPAGAP